MQLSSEYYEALGRVTVEAADVEFYAQYLIIRLVDDVPFVTVTLVANMPFAQLVGRGKHLARTRLSGEALERTLAWLKEAPPALEARNKLVHRSWHELHDVAARTTTTNRVEFTSAGGRVSTGVELEYVNHVAHRLAEVSMQARAMFVAIDAQLGPIRPEQTTR